MPIGTDDTIEKFGTADTVSAGSTSAVTDGSFSAAADAVDWTNDDDANRARARLTVTFASAPDAFGTIGLYARHMNIDGVSDAPEPSADFPATLVGVFRVEAAATTQRILCDMYLPNWDTSQVYNFYVANETGQSMAAGWDLDVKPVAAGPHA